jgi:hypothetical protein
MAKRPVPQARRIRWQYLIPRKGRFSCCIRSCSRFAPTNLRLSHQLLERAAHFLKYVRRHHRPPPLRIGVAAGAAHQSTRSHTRLGLAHIGAQGGYNNSGDDSTQRPPSTTEKSAHSAKRDAPLCSPKTSVSTLLHLPLSTRLDEISLPPAAHIGAVFGPFRTSWGGLISRLLPLPPPPPSLLPLLLLLGRAQSPQLPLVLDADGLWLINQRPDLVKGEEMLVRRCMPHCHLHATYCTWILTARVRGCGTHTKRDGVQAPVQGGVGD